MENNTKNTSWADAASRNWLAILIVSFTFIAIFILAYWFYDDDPGEETMKYVFATLVPLFASWVGTVLAFYFGRENFDIATKRYDNLMNQLTPEVLDNVNVSQIMIAKKTMVYKELDSIKSQNIKDIITFMNDIKKSRLPILDKDQIKYIVHKSTFLEALNNEPSSTVDKFNFETFIKNSNNAKRATSFLSFQDNVILEDIQKAMAKEPQKKDVFITDANKNVVGWLTDSLILRFLSSPDDSLK